MRKGRKFGFSELWNIPGEIVETRTAADGTILSYEVDICIPGKGSYRSTRHLRLMRKYNVPLMAENEDNEVADSSIPDSADFRMNGSVPTSPSKSRKEEEEEEGRKKG